MQKNKKSDRLKIYTEKKLSPSHRRHLTILEHFLKKIHEIDIRKRYLRIFVAKIVLNI